MRKEINMEKDIKHKWLALSTLALAVSLIVIDGTIINVAIPVIMKDLKLNFTQVEWITTLYALVFSALLITTGRIADHVGRRKMLMLGIVIFIIGSIFASTAKGINSLLFARFIQGIGGAVVLPTTLSAVNSTFFGRDRIIAFAVWGSVISGMAAIGPLVGGYFCTYVSWRWIFWINVPIGVIILIGALKFVPETYGEKLTNGFDFLGFIVSSLGLASLVYGLIEGRNLGWIDAKDPSKEILGISYTPYLIVFGFLLLVLFILWEKHQVKNGKTHLLDVTLFRLKSFTLGNTIACLVAIGEFGLLFVLPLFLQNILGLSAMDSGFILASLGIGAFVSGGFASEIGRRTSPTVVASLGLFVETVGLAGFYFTVVPDISKMVIVLWLVVYGIGLGMASAQLTSTVLVDVPPVKSGQGSATQSTVRQLGSALGIALMGTILVSFLTVNVNTSLKNIAMPEQSVQGIETSVIETAGASIAGIKQDNRLMHMPQQERQKLFTALDDSFTKSSVDTIGVSALILGFGFILSLFLPKKKKTE